MAGWGPCFDYALAPAGQGEASAGLRRRWPTVLVLVLLAIKLGATVWVCAVFDGATYDESGLHAPRARTGGLGLEGRIYNPPLYYLPAYPLAARQARELGGWPEAEATHAAGKASREDPERRALDDQLLQRLRWTNLVHVAVFYFAWLGLILPRLIRDRWPRLIAALMLLALPGYQKLAAMVHPDAAMVSLTSATLAYFVVLRTRERPAKTWQLLVLALLGGLAAFARPFGALTALFAVVAAAWLAWRGSAGPPRSYGRIVGQSLGAALIAAALVGAWPAYQVAKLGGLAPVYSSTYTERYAAAREDFDYAGYFTSFHGVDLIRRPNRWVRRFDEEHDRYHNRYGNSFWTLLYSETWGDHWLHVSGPVGEERRAVAKRVALAAALPTIPWLGFRMFTGLRGLVQRLRDEAEDRDLWLLLFGFFTLGCAAYLYWHLSDGLSPGKNSSVKFIYNAYLYPLALALCFSTPLLERGRKLALAYVLILFAATLPISIFIPS